MVDKITELREAVKIRNAMADYQDTVYLNLIRQLNTNCQEVLQEDLGSMFISNCGRDIAGELVRNYFDTSNYCITVDQLAKRILQFSYENEYDPLAANGGVGEISKTVYNYNEMKSEELDNIAERMDAAQEKLFTESRETDKLDAKGKTAYRESKTDNNGVIYDELTGREGDNVTYIRNGKEVQKSDLQADHVQARESATYNSRYVAQKGMEELKEFWNSADNMQMMQQSANSSKGDIRVCNIDGEIQFVNARSKDYDPSTDITHKATPEQLADAACAQWEKVDESREQKNQPKIQVLKDKGYLDEDGKVPKSVRKKLIENIRHSQNVESVTVLKNTKYGQVAKDAMEDTKGAIGKIIAGQIVYYAAPPLVYELKTILKDKNIKLDNALEKLGASAKRIGEYVFSKIKDIFSNILSNSLKKFIKSFMDIIINLVKASVKKLLKMAKNLVVSTVDAVRIIADKNASRAEKANSVVNLYAVVVTSCVVELLFELAADALHLPNPFDDIVFGPLQVLVTVICTNLTLLILQKADLFDVNYGFKMSKIRALFKETQEAFAQEYALSSRYADEEIGKLIEAAKKESYAIYQSLEEMSMNEQSARGELEKINTMFSMGINYEAEWLKFLGIVTDI